jgi:ATP/maltotriose-dependent transcriptional regulator MalT
VNETRETRALSPRELKALIEAERIGVPFVHWPATNPQIAAEVHLSVDAVKAHLRILFDRFGVGDLPQNEKRSRLVSIVISSGALAAHDF